MLTGSVVMRQIGETSISFDVPEPTVELRLVDVLFDPQIEGVRVVRFQVDGRLLEGWVVVRRDGETGKYSFEPAKTWHQLSPTPAMIFADGSRYDDCRPIGSSPDEGRIERLCDYLNEISGVAK